MNNINIKRLESNLINRKFNEKKPKKENKSFREVLERIDSKPIKISKHAKERIDSRKIRLDKADLEAIHKAIETASSKGVEEALIIRDGDAFIVDINSKTIITALENSSLKENVFTNIDGAVIL